jgi:hypothetical protein
VELCKKILNIKGVVLYEMIVGTTPFRCRNKKDALELVMTVLIKF